MYKNIFIIGTGRAGKTTLSKMINKRYEYSIISIDDRALYTLFANYVRIRADGPR